MVKTLEAAIEEIELVPSNSNLDEDTLGLETAFNPADWIGQVSEEKGLGKQATITTFERKVSFKKICKIVKDELYENNENEDNEGKIAQMLERQHKAVIGDRHEMSRFTNQITEVLRKQNITSKDYPDFYGSLAEAVFHEVWGVGILHKWEKYPDSEACVIRGTELWIDINGKFVKQDETYENEEAVERVKRAFLIRMKDAVLNEQKPEIEIEREDGSRITMIQKPRSRDNYVMFRRFVVQDLSLLEQSKRETIPERDIPIYQALSKAMVNIVFAGRVRSAKTTFMKTMIRERKPEYIGAVMEKHFELGLSKHFPDRLFFEVQAKEGDLHKAMPRLLRMEHDYIIVGEIRSLETEAYLQSSERGERGNLTTYHLTNVDNVVEQIARHILDEFPTRNIDNEIARVAQNIDIVITLKSDRDRRRKRVIGVTEIVWDEKRRMHFTQDLIRFSPLTNKYYYSSKISKELFMSMMEESEEDAKRLLTLLSKREQESGMSEYLNLKDNSYDSVLEGVGEGETIYG
ncbi:secretion system protein E (plasmid) [Rossellomorea marisflavi]|uniref:ATPase, T2SS/T4P/T4SS family n=1 Tax=Rossellomorea marisflavi TaxID=189381 RepID=UPI0013197848|nr:ATPase, T2SS/T4P/T4SS family [Rossellomorea marisflavi]QHA38724.1 secretion system protein E [Rossellomorea marisflavi]